jgi:hypothetical protein
MPSLSHFLSLGTTVIAVPHVVLDALLVQIALDLLDSGGAKGPGRTVGKIAMLLLFWWGAAPLYRIWKVVARKNYVDAWNWRDDEEAQSGCMKRCCKLPWRTWWGHPKTVFLVAFLVSHVLTPIVTVINYTKGEREATTQVLGFALPSIILLAIKCGMSAVSAPPQS